MWFIEHGYEIKTFFIWFDIDVENDLPSHTFLLYKNGDKWNWFENAFELRRGIREYTSIEDAIEDATDAEDACKRLGKLDLLWKTWSVNRETDSYVRLLHIDGFGNHQYLTITK